MAKLIAEKDGYSLSLDVEYYNILDIECFSRMMKNPSYCYKFYWLEAIVQLISQGVKETTFDAVIDEMIFCQRISHPFEWDTDGWSSQRWSGASCTQIIGIE